MCGAGFCCVLIEASATAPQRIILYTKVRAQRQCAAAIDHSIIPRKAQAGIVSLLAGERQLSRSRMEV